MNGKTAAELQDEAAMRAAIGNKITMLTKSWGSEKLKIEMEYVFRCERPLQHGTSQANSASAVDTEPPRAECGTKEDYQSLLALKTSDYASMTVADFNAKLLAWADEDFSRTERVDADMLCNDFQVSLSKEEHEFIRLTAFLSGTENGKFVQSNYTGDPVTDPVYQKSLPQKEDKSDQKSPLWCDFGYRFSYHIANQQALTVGERDRCIGGMIIAVEKFWNDTTLDVLLTMTKDDVISRLNSLATEYSANDIAITISTGQVHFDHTEERIELP